MDNSELNKKIGQSLAKLRKEHNLSQQQLADEINISRSAISRYEKGNRTIDSYVLNEILSYFQISYENFITGNLLNDKDFKNIEGNKQNKNGIQCDSVKTSRIVLKDKIIYLSLLTGVFICLVTLFFMVIFSILNPVYISEIHSIETLWWYLRWDTPDLICFKVFFIFFACILIVLIVLIVRKFLHEKKNNN